MGLGRFRIIQIVSAIIDHPGTAARFDRRLGVTIASRTDVSGL